MPSHRFRALLAKELRQIRRSRGALLSATLLPFFLMVITPIGQYLSLQNAPTRELPPGFAPPGLMDMERPEEMLTLLLLPLLVVLAGLIVPTTAAAYTIVAERDRRSLELLVALPVGVRDILLAKLAATVILAAGVLLPLFAIDAVWLLSGGLASVGYVLLLLGLMLSGLICSVALALLVTLLARDMRTANQVSAALVGPVVLVLLAVLLAVPGEGRWAAAVTFLLFVAVVGLLAALHWLTYERYLA
ncbi:MAG TPA: ABC transporter permease subunit [Chloroflexota bacterium]|nr:ABC transporter permease subunit [Chloroflexota bacterium]